MVIKRTMPERSKLNRPTLSVLWLRKSQIALMTVRIIAEGTPEKPTISVFDFGEGQHPKDFPKTFLSIGGSNKIKIKFAHGVYNQGGSAALKFCGNGYQLILSRRAPNILGDAEDLLGF